jgi:F-type H+-transporting ATPase subunit gamma
MPTAREIKGHIYSIRSISKVTRALETVSAVKNRRLQARLESTRIFAEKSWEVLNHLVSAAESYAQVNPLFCGYPDVKRLAMLLIASDRGMVGTYNLDVIALATNLCRSSPLPVELITIGKIGRDAMLRRGFQIHADFSQLGDAPDITAMTPVARVLLDGFHDRIFDKVTMVYTQFKPGARLRPTTRQLLPVCPERPVTSREYIYEPEPQELISALLPRLIRFQIYEAFQESLFAENVSRMMAMRSATRNAQELIENLTMSYHKARQQAITAEIMDILGGAGAVGGG